MTKFKDKNTGNILIPGSQAVIEQMKNMPNVYEIVGGEEADANAPTESTKSEITTQLKEKGVAVTGKENKETLLKMLADANAQ